MITWDSKNDSDYCWSYDTYFSNNLSDSKKLIESSVDSIAAAMPVATVEHPTIFYSDVLKAELVSGLSFVTLLAMNVISNYLSSIYNITTFYPKTPFHPTEWINSPGLMPVDYKNYLYSTLRASFEQGSEFFSPQSWKDDPLVN